LFGIEKVYGCLASIVGRLWNINQISAEPPMGYRGINAVYLNQLSQSGMFVPSAYEGYRITSVVDHAKNINAAAVVPCNDSTGCMTDIIACVLPAHCINVMSTGERTSPRRECSTSITALHCPTRTNQPASSYTEVNFPPFSKMERTLKTSAADHTKD
jgi:hypothetical protein